MYIIITSKLIHYKSFVVTIFSSYNYILYYKFHWSSNEQCGTLELNGFSKIVGKTGEEDEVDEFGFGSKQPVTHTHSQPVSL